MKLHNQTAIITGAAAGIGRVIAQTMASLGARVVIADIQDDSGTETERHIREAGGEAVYVRCDVGSEADVQQLVATAIQRYNSIDILVNNAAVAIGGSVTEMSEDDWQKLMNINMGGTFRCCKHAIPHMIDGGGGAIVSMASAQAHVGYHGWTAYAAAKGGIIAMTQQLAVEYAPHQIRVNCVSPATINTPMLEQVVRESPDPNLRASWEAMHPIGRIGEADEVASAVVFLASDESSFITGVDLKVDGGLTLNP